MSTEGTSESQWPQREMSGARWRNPSADPSRARHVAARTAPIDNTWPGLLASNYPSSRSWVIYRSRSDVVRAVPAHLSRGLVFLVAALCLLAATGNSRASGCHVPELPVLASKMSWDNEFAIDLSPATPVQAPPVLARPPCHGEVPHLLVPADGPSAALSHRIGIDLPGRSGSIPAGSTALHPQPFGTRLDRPPRLVERSVIIGLTD